VNDDAPYITAAVQPAQQHEQIVAHRASDATVGDLKGPIRLALARANGSHHDLTVEPMRDDHGPWRVRQDVDHTAATALAAGQDHWSPHSFLLYY
jgi:hypothetical protein